MIRKDQEERFHLTQKPVAVMTWALRHLPAWSYTILDPFAGVASIGVAAVRLGKAYTGIEVQEKYHSVACRRIEAAYKQPDLFLPRTAPTPALVQPLLFSSHKEASHG
jgi:DNA modification methylase